MKIFLINLPEDHERLAFMRRQLDSFGLEFEVLPAIRGAHLTAKERGEVYDRKKALLYCSRDLTSGEIGCSLSHLTVYRRMMEERISLALVLEDDVAFDERFPSILAQAAAFMQHRHRSICLLSEAQCGEAVAGPPSNEDTFRIFAFKAGFFAHCYLIDLAAAQALSDCLFPVHDVADCWARLVREFVITAYVVSPCVTRQLQSRFGVSSRAEIQMYVRGNFGRILIYKFRRILTVLLVDGEPILRRLVGLRSKFRRSD